VTSGSEIGGNGNSDGKVPGREPLQRQLPRRFYSDVSVEESGGGHRILLDGRPVRTPQKAELSVPQAALAEALAEEWREQGEFIDPETMPLTKMVNTALDAVTGREAAVAADIAAFAGSDLTCYRAEHPTELVAMQAKAWGPVLSWAQERLGAEFVLTEGVIPVNQPPEAAQAVADAIAQYDALSLAGLHVMTTLTGSALIALAHAQGRLTAEEAWDAAHVDEDFQISQWGEDQEAMERRARRWAEFQAASRLVGFVNDSGENR
jgi:chaperone required for assembly of F1-ATPase